MNTNKERDEKKPKVAVYHRANPMYRGGGEAVCVQTLAGLQSAEYDVTLLTVGENLDFSIINRFFGTSLKAESIDVRFVDPPSIRVIRWILTNLKNLTPFETEFMRLQYALVDWYVNRIRKEYDLLVNTFGEGPSQGTTIDYVHFPSNYVYSNRDLDSIKGIGSHLQKNIPALLYPIYDGLVSYIQPDNLSNSYQKTTLVNSRWTRSMIKERYGVKSNVLYPPVRTEDFSSPPFKEREYGFVCIGRIEEAKNILRTIEIIDELRDRFDVHLHIIGKISEPGYGKRMKEKARGKSYIELEGMIPREELIGFIESHKFGIHGMDTEHFGIVVAEMVAGGCIPFVPDDGGQVEIVDRNPHLLYSDKNEAVEKISEMLEDKELQKKTIRRLEGRGERFSAERFKRKMKEIVAEKLG